MLVPDSFVAILDEARSQVAAGRAPNVEGLEARLAAAARSAGVEGAGVERARRELQSIAAVHRARVLVSREPRRAPARRAPAAALRAKATISGSLDVRRSDGFRLVWDTVPAVSEWEVRVSERRDLRSGYVERESFALAADETSLELPLGDGPLRVSIVGRGRGRLQRRALISGLTRENWPERWQRRASS